MQPFYTSNDNEDDWFHKRYDEPYHGANLRYYTFLVALTLLYQRHPNPVIVETGCQRQEEDVGAGMSTSIFAEYIDRYGGKLIVVDNCEEHLNRAIGYVSKWPNNDIKFMHSDSVSWLEKFDGQCDLLYLDSLDYPIGEKADDTVLQMAAQCHCLNEFKVVEERLPADVLLLADDNRFPGGGKPAMLKEHLREQGYICLLDLQQTLWVKRL